MHPDPTPGTLPAPPAATPPPAEPAAAKAPSTYIVLAALLTEGRPHDAAELTDEEIAELRLSWTVVGEASADGQKKARGIVLEQRSEQLGTYAEEGKLILQAVPKGSWHPKWVGPPTPSPRFRV